MPSPGVEWREPLHHFRVLIGYDIFHIDGIVIAIRYVIVVDIIVTKRGRVRICSVVHGTLVQYVQIVGRAWICYSDNYCIVVGLGLMKFAPVGLGKGVCGSNC